MHKLVLFWAVALCTGSGLVLYQLGAEDVIEGPCTPCCRWADPTCSRAVPRGTMSCIFIRNVFQKNLLMFLFW